MTAGKFARRGLLLPLALAPVAAWAVWRGSDAVTAETTGEFHFPGDPGNAIWRLLMSATRTGNVLSVAEVPPAAAALDGTTVTLLGFAQPVDDTAVHRRFMFSANPLGCTGCRQPGPADTIDVRTARPVALTGEPLRLTGVVRLHRFRSRVWRLDDAEIRIG